MLSEFAVEAEPVPNPPLSCVPEFPLEPAELRRSDIYRTSAAAHFLTGPRPAVPKSANTDVCRRSEGDTPMSANRSRQTRPKLLLEKPDHLAHALQRKTPPAKLANHGHCNQFVPAIIGGAPGETEPRCRVRPPLQLAGGDAGQCDHVAGCELSLHLEAILFQTIRQRNVRTF